MFHVLSLVFIFYFFFQIQCIFAVEPMHCYVNITHDFHENQPLLLRHNSSEFLYPRIFSPSIFDLTSGKPEIRVACPTDVLVVNNHTLGFGTAFLRCHGIWDFTIAGSMQLTAFNKIGCSKSLIPSTRMKRNNCPMGKCIQIGYLVNLFTFLPIIDTIAYDTENKIPLWAHAKIIPVIESRQRTKATHEYKAGLLLHNSTIEMSDVYNREYQRKRLLNILDDPQEMDLYQNDLIEEDSKYFVEGQLISKNDFYYTSQQQGTYFYENVVPMWKSVHDGNWRQVSIVVRKLASETMSDLDVWSGCIGVLAMHSNNDAQRKIFLARDSNNKSIVPAPKILFKYIYDRRANRGLVILVVNNPHIDKISTDYVICKRQIICETMFPTFSHIDKGYTYCCTLDGFLETAKSLGLPTFSGATSIGT